MGPPKSSHLSLALLALIVGASNATSQSTTTRTLQRTPNDQIAPARVEDLAWLTGEWRGSAPGVIIEETWTAPSGNSLQGMFKYVKDGATVFYELFVIVPDSGGLSLRLKHFHADLRGWEERNDMRRFVLLRHAPGVAEFDGMTYSLVGRDTLRAIVAMRQSDGRRKEEEFIYLRVKAAVPPPR